MKIFLSALAILFLLLTIVSKIRRRFKPGQSPNQTPIMIGIVISILAIAAIFAKYYYSEQLKDLTKLAIPVFVLVILVDQWRRNKKYY